jgi:CBS domain containing-hemolysin-like protein
VNNTTAFVSLFVLLLLSFFFSYAETAFTAVNKLRIKHLAEKGSGRAKLALRLNDDFDRLLSSLLIGTNVANLSAAAICTLLFANAYGDIGATLSTVFLTVTVIIFAEVTPKTLAKESPEKAALFCAPIVYAFMVLFVPFTAFFRLWTKGLVRVFKTSSNDDNLTEDELLYLIEEASNSGVIDKDDKELIHNVIEFYGQKADDILTPRMDITAISNEATTEEIASLFLETGFSRIPVYDKSIDNIIGILHTRDFLGHILNNDTPLEKIISPAIFVPSTIDIGDLFNLLKKAKNHMAVVIDEHGGTDGIVTMEDILEELMGEIWDESDTVVEPFTLLEANKYKVICSADAYDFFEYFDLSKDDVDEMPATVSGWIVNMLGKLPEKGDSFEYEDMTVTVSEAEGKRALECVVVRGEI